MSEASNSEAHPERIGHYRVIRRLGRGDFGASYLAYDERGNRSVTIKVIAEDNGLETVAAYRERAEKVARLKHANIVSVEEICSAPDFPCFLVSEFVDGRPLTSERVSAETAAQLIAALAEALRAGHRAGIKHLDIRPSNLVIDRHGTPFFLDFGLALREGGASPRTVDSVAYLSPEQASGLGHRVEESSDIFSLGAVFYELLTGRRPFEGDTVEAVLGQINAGELRPPRSIDDTIDRELERICVRALQLRIPDRHSTAGDFAEDLKTWLLHPRVKPAALPPVAKEGFPPTDAFISHASQDIARAKEICEALERRGFKCWIAPRNIPSGQEWEPTLPHAIAATRVLLCLISDHTDGSKQVRREVGLADQGDKLIVPIRLQNIPLGVNLKFILSSKQWINAYQLAPDRLTADLAELLRKAAETASSAAMAPTAIAVVDDDEQTLIEPKGPGNFEEKDAHYFLRLLPGQRDRNGLPPGVVFWKDRVESQDPEHTFCVGLVHGPSGCGKTSRVKAALLTRLAPTVISVYLESTSDATESRMLRELRKKVPALPPGIDLVSAMAAIRQGQYAPAGHKVTLFLDQFEQWLHANHEDHNAVLAQALRHCDGVRLQCVLMIRDDFWTAVTRFMHSLEVDIDKNNARMIDLFDLKHAREVLILFGQAMGTLPRRKAEITREQNQFLDRAIRELAVEKRIVCVRLSMFAEMVKDMSWTPATLDAVGGIDGIGATFLEEKFASRNAGEQYTRHQQAAQKVLRALLPEVAMDIKGHRRSLADLLAASEYGDDTRRFGELLDILHGELRLIALADREGHKDDANRDSADRPPKHYQLTHDYLVPSLRDWLNRKQKETRRGRAELRLQEYASVWDHRRADRHLPSIFLWLQILRSVSLRKASEVQKAMVRRASFYHLTRLGILVAVGVALTYSAFASHNRIQAESLRKQIVGAKTGDVPGIVKGQEYYRPWLDPLLKESFAEADERKGARAKLNISLALLPVDSGQLEYLAGRLLEADPGDVAVLVSALEPHGAALSERLWDIAEYRDGDPQRRLRAAAALAKFERGSERWRPIRQRIVEDLVSENPIHLGAWLEAFEPVKQALLEPLLAVLRRPLNEITTTTIQSVAAARTRERIAAERGAERGIASNLLLNYAADDSYYLTEALLESDDQQFAKFFAALKNHREADLYLLRELDRNLGGVGDPKYKDRLANRMANAGVFLIMLNTKPIPTVWNLLRLTADPSVRSYLISRIGRLGADPKVVAAHLLQDIKAPTYDAKYDVRNDPGVHRALIQCLGAFPDSRFEGGLRTQLRDYVRKIYRGSPDAGLHASSEWLLREWGDGDWLQRSMDEWVLDPLQKGKPGKILAEYSDFLRNPSGEIRPEPRWFAGGQGHTLVAIPGRIDFKMGSPDGELGHLKSEAFKRKKIARSFAISAKLTTIAQFDKFDGGTHAKDLPGEFGGDTALRGHPEKPVVRATWFQVAKYCNWLSAREGIHPDEWCYAVDKNGDVIGMKSDYLELNGYRLPTEAEVEYANRATTRTCRHYGETEELLGEYAWYEKNSDEITQPVGTRKPNDFGLFDMQGNAFTWCQDLLPGPGAKYNEEDVSIAEPEIVSTGKRVLRGGAFYFMAISLRAARQHHDVPTMQGLYYGFRVCKTLK